MKWFRRIFKGTDTSNKIILGSGSKSHVIEFLLWEDDLPLEIQLEPDCLIFKVEPGNTLKFVAVSNEYFEWSIRIDRKLGSVQLFPEGKGDYDIEIYENGELLEDWYKYM